MHKKPILLLFLLSISLLFSSFMSVKGVTSWQTAYPLHDSYVREGNNNTNYGSSQGLTIGKDGTGWIRTWMQFNLSSIGGTFSVSSITLHVYCTGSIGPPTVKVYRSTNDSWAESTITWNNQPGYNSTLVDQQVCNGLQWESFNVTSPVQTEFAGDKVVSFCLLTTEAIGFCTLTSKDSVVQEKRPYLKYLLDDEVTAPESDISDWSLPEEGADDIIEDVSEVLGPPLSKYGLWLIIGAIAVFGAGGVVVQSSKKKVVRSPKGRLSTPRGPDGRFKKRRS